MQEAQKSREETDKKDHKNKKEDLLDFFDDMFQSTDQQIW